MRRKTALVLTFFVFGGSAVAFFLLLHNDPITRSSYERIRLGMTKKEVEAILGGQGREAVSSEERPGPPREIEDMPSEGEWDNLPDDNEPGRRLDWSGQNGVIALRFGPGEVVTDKMFIALKPLSLLDRLRWHIGLRAAPPLE